MIKRGLDINQPIDGLTFQQMRLSGSLLTHFVGATPCDFNYRGNENLQRWFGRNGGRRNYR